MPLCEYVQRIAPCDCRRIDGLRNKSCPLPSFKTLELYQNSGFYRILRSKCVVDARRRYNRADLLERLYKFVGIVSTLWAVKRHRTKTKYFIGYVVDEQATGVGCSAKT